MRAKFQVSEVIQRVDQNGAISGATVKMRADYGGEGTPNAAWSKWTPSGLLEMHITNPDAYNHFRPGQDYYLDFTLVED